MAQVVSLRILLMTPRESPTGPEKPREAKAMTWAPSATPHCAGTKKKMVFETDDQGGDEEGRDEAHRPSEGRRRRS